jgi:hypothetical protein
VGGLVELAVLAVNWAARMYVGVINDPPEAKLAYWHSKGSARQPTHAVDRSWPRPVLVLMMVVVAAIT